jgi:hypothetical protein
MERSMSKQAAGSERLNQSRENTTGKLRDSDHSSSEIFDRIGNATEQTGHVASDVAETLGSDLKEFCNQQLRSGAKMGNNFASSLRVAASALPPDASMLASVMRSAAKQVDGYAAELGHQNIDQVAAGASAFIRRRPAVIFGLTAVVGFLAFRTFKSAQPVPAPSLPPASAPSIQPASAPSIQPTRSPSDPVHG